MFCPEVTTTTTTSTPKKKNINFLHFVLVGEHVFNFLCWICWILIENVYSTSSRCVRTVLCYSFVAGSGNTLGVKEQERIPCDRYTLTYTYLGTVVVLRYGDCGTRGTILFFFSSLLLMLCHRASNIRLTHPWHWSCFKCYEIRLLLEWGSTTRVVISDTNANENTNEVYMHSCMEIKCIHAENEPNRTC